MPSTFLRNKIRFTPGDMVSHPLTGYIGLLICLDENDKWMVEWFATREWKILKRSLRTKELDPALNLMAKTEYS